MMMMTVSSVLIDVTPDVFSTRCVLASPDVETECLHYNDTGSVN